MKKTGVIGILAGLLVIALIFPLVSGLSVSVTDKSPVVIAGTNEPAVYEFKIERNGGDSSEFELISLEGLSFSPRGYFAVDNSGIVEVKVFPNSDVLRNKRGLNTLSYKLIGQKLDSYEGTINMRIVGLDDVISIYPENVLPGDEALDVGIQNMQNIMLENISVEMSSSLFSGSARVSLAPYEKKVVGVNLDTAKMSRLVAGPYIVSAVLQYGSAKAKTEGIVNYLEKEGTSVSRTKSGLLVRKYTLTKTNEGNVPVDAKIEVKKNVISRLFTSFSVEPSSAQRGAFFVNYLWERNLGPSEVLSVTVSTNYTIPFIIILLIVIAAVLVKAANRTNVVLKKRVSFVKTKGGEFALKVTLNVSARKDANNIKLIDYIPHSSKLYEGYGRKPDEVHEHERRLAWNIDRLNAGEERVFSYVIYSQIRVVGRFELPTAKVMFDSAAGKEIVLSNKAYFVSDLMTRDEWS